jgi:hypothetical protein|tara:strand:- start:176 stop:361 length:186 start_codon:yes stop_codon:yes gene_type:complete
MEQENIIKSVMDGDFISARKETKNTLYRKAAEQMDAVKAEISANYAQRPAHSENDNHQEGE